MTIRLSVIAALALMLAFRWPTSTAFSVSQMMASRRMSGPALSYSLYDQEGDSPAERKLRARTSVRNLLTQRAVQSFIELLISCRDPHTVQWLQSNLLVSNLEHFHGTGAFNTTLFPNWDSVLLEVLSKPRESVEITRKSRRAAGGGGWRGQIGGWNQPQKQESKRNPHMQEHVERFQIDIDPVSLVSRIISVREQVAAECKTDFGTLIVANDQILASYEDHMVEDQKSDLGMEEFDSDSSLDSLTIPYSDSKESTSNHHKHAFDRYNAMLLLSNSMGDESDMKSSPLRKGNFDLMLLLSTQESIHRVLKEYAQAGDERDVSFAWLRDFYLERVNDYFDGHQRFGRADDFLEELLLTPPMLKSLDDSAHRQEMMGLIDPLRIAEDIIRKRGEVGREWKEIMGNTPHEHMELRRELLARQMGERIEICINATFDSTFDVTEGFE